MDIERGLGFDPTDREFEKLGYDVESRIPGTGKLRFIEVKGRVAGAPTITVTRNEILSRSTSRTTSFWPSSNSSTPKRIRCITCASRSVASRILASPALITTLPNCWRGPPHLLDAP
jgi:hypothetical protein